LQFKNSKTIMKKPRLLVFASGGGSGFQKLVEATSTGALQAGIVAVVSNHPSGGVYEKAKHFKVPFIHFPGPFDAEFYEGIVESTRPDFIALSGWLKLAKGLNPYNTFNIHPGPLPRFGGPGLYGHHVHEAVVAAYKKGELGHSEVSMHFVTDEYDKGPVFFRMPVPIEPDDTPETLAKRVNAVEHQFQALVTDMVVRGDISWNGVHPDSLVVPDGYEYHLPLQ
jgi:phosphoribosylglycinamide formyltransferase-1